VGKSLQRLYTIGHGNKGLDALVEALKAYSIRTLVDIRSYPRSKRNPHFNLEALEAALPQKGIAYVWYKGLGGYRNDGLGARSPHVVLKSPGLRNYADHMLAKSFKEDIDRILQLARIENTCLMCAETLPFRCHRWILSDYLVANEVDVVHVLDVKKTSCHSLSKHARVKGHDVFYDRVVREQR
jgi:uncharacterized protein (DUF488 family)